jgi:hypothetical protein
VKRMVETMGKGQGSIMEELEGQVTGDSVHECVW